MLTRLKHFSSDTHTNKTSSVNFFFLSLFSVKQEKRFSLSHDLCFCTYQLLLSCTG